MIKKRRFYDKTFKREAVNLCLHSEKSLAEMAADSGVSEDLLYQWRRKLEKDETEPDINYDQLKRELAETRLERDRLKKHWAFSQKHRNDSTYEPKREL